MRTRLGYLGVICVFLVVVGVLFWPGVYQYAELKISMNGVPVTTFGRVNRLTGSTQEYIGGRWLAPSRARLLPKNAMSQLVGYAGLSADGTFSGNLHNGSTWTVTQIVVRVTGQALRARPGAPAGPWTRILSIDVRTPPNTTALMHDPVTDPREFTERQIVLRGWTVDRAYGYP
ncbi:MAG TPA: hypothetical protein VJT32_14350 [bacterium]|nr:hypothetical protein [bacterium]